MIDNQHEFYLLSEIFISLIGGLLLLAIWSTVQNHFKNQLSHEISIKRVDKGLLYLSLSIFVWCFSGLITYLNLSSLSSGWIILISQNIFSILNSLFIILALFVWSELMVKNQNGQNLDFMKIGQQILREGA